MPQRKDVNCPRCGKVFKRAVGPHADAAACPRCGARVLGKTVRGLRPGHPAEPRRV